MNTQLPSEVLPETLSVERRVFLGTAALAAGAALAGALAPGLWVTPRPAPVSADTAFPPAPPAADDSWHVDDMWGHRPRYAHPVPYLHAQSQLAMLGPVDPVDRALVV
ncbi:MAG TPA: hypothetical protein VMG11_06410 [Steroidobacteraceae bacterium]|nr:hypothetical protein [Steroidobacteraceae bacterium]